MSQKRWDVPKMATRQKPLNNLIWCVMIWHDMIWYDIIWYDMIWYEKMWCCWWKNSCTTWDVRNHVNDGIFTISTGAGFLSSTVHKRSDMVDLSTSMIILTESSTSPGDCLGSKDVDKLVKHFFLKKCLESKWFFGGWFGDFIQKIVRICWWFLSIWCF